jgi:hypothetical protein
VNRITCRTVICMLHVGCGWSSRRCTEDRRTRDFEYVLARERVRNVLSKVIAFNKNRPSFSGREPEETRR